MKSSKPNDWRDFEVYPGLKAKALVVDGNVQQVKLVTHVPRGYYYSFLNDAEIEAEKLFSNGKN